MLQVHSNNPYLSFHEVSEIVVVLEISAYCIHSVITEVEGFFY